MAQLILKFGWIQLYVGCFIFGLVYLLFPLFLKDFWLAFKEMRSGESSSESTEGTSEVYGDDVRVMPSGGNTGDTGYTGDSSSTIIPVSTPVNTPIRVRTSSFHLSFSSFFVLMAVSGFLLSGLNEREQTLFKSWHLTDPVAQFVVSILISTVIVGLLSVTLFRLFTDEDEETEENYN